MFQPNPDQLPDTEQEIKDNWIFHIRWINKLSNWKLNQQHSIASPNKKASGFDLITGNVLREVTENRYKLLTHLKCSITALILSLPMESCRNSYDLKTTQNRK